MASLETLRCNSLSVLSTEDLLSYLTSKEAFICEWEIKNESEKV